MNGPSSIFISHGAPTFALEPGVAGPLLAEVGREFARPEAVLIVSPHWMTRGVRVGASARPETIHDYGGFPRELYRLRYPAPGHPELARETARRLQASGLDVTLDEERGLDHGAWVPMMHLFPQADVPVFQVSMPTWLDSPGAWNLGAALAPIAARGVWIVGSGSMTHNLAEFRSASVGEELYVAEFVAFVRAAVVSGDRDRIVHLLERAPHAARAHPTADHFLPLIVAAGAAPAGAPVRVLRGGTTHGMLSMESYLFGAGESPASNREGRETVQRDAATERHA